jgi:hypothetical protein
VAGSREQQAFRAGVGSVNWLAITNRPDLAFAISQLACFLANPTATHTAALVHVLKYIVLTRHRSLCYGRHHVIDPAIRRAEVWTFVTANQRTGFCDADFANNVETRNSYTGFACMLNHAAVDWKSSQQRLVASSSTESEFLALSHCVKQAQYLRHLQHFLGHTQTAPTPILADNAAFICLCNSDSHESRLKHLDVHLHNTRQHVARNTISLYYVATAYQAADYMTKAVSGEGMQRPNAILFGQDRTAWDNEEGRLPLPRPTRPDHPQVRQANNAARREDPLDVPCRPQH